MIDTMNAMYTRKSSQNIKDFWKWRIVVISRNAYKHTDSKELDNKKDWEQIISALGTTKLRQESYCQMQFVLMI